MIKIVDENFSSEEWNKVVEHPLQSWKWGEARQKMGQEVVKIGVWEKNRLVSGFLLTVHRIPKTNLKIAYLARSSLPNAEVTDFLYKWARHNKVIFIKIEPYVERSSKFKVESLKLKRSPHQLFPDWTMILDISKPEEEILKEMKPKTRYNIRLAEKKGVEVEEMTSERGFEIFSKLYFDTTRRQKYFGHNEGYHRTIFETLKDKLVYILIAFLENKPLAAYELFIFKNRAYYPYGGSSTVDRNLMAPNLLMWEAIKYAKKKNVKYFDMWGSSAPDAPDEDIYAGFTRFKEGYGAKFTEMIGSYDLVVNSFYYNLYSVAYKARNWYLNLVFFR